MLRIFLNANIAKKITKFAILITTDIFYLLSLMLLAEHVCNLLLFSLLLWK